MRKVRLFDTSHFQQGEYAQLFQRRSIFLSASEPYLRKEVTPRNRHYVKTAEPRRILDAVSYLSQFVFQQDLNLVFGGHPAISPMVLDIARRFLHEEGKRVVVFQSAFFADAIPEETLRLAAWKYGHLLWTACQPSGKRRDRDASLLWMRKVMLSTPNLIAGVFVGGMEGCVEEARMMKHIVATGRKGRIPCFAIGSTGGAAADLLEADPEVFSGTHADAHSLKTLRSYPLVMKKIFKDIDYL